MVAFGMQLPIQSPEHDLRAAVGAGRRRRPSSSRSTQACEAAGFDYVAVCDHVAIPAAKAEAMSTTWWDTVATLSYLAAVTERVRLLSHVYVLPYRHPLAVAKAWATLDQLSGGRAILGVGTGHVEGEFEALDVPFADRGRLLDEAIDAVRAALTDEFATPPRRPLAVRRRRPAPAAGAGDRADLGRRLVEAGHAPGRRARRRLAAAGAARGRDGRGHRLRPRPPRRDARRRSDRARRAVGPAVRRRARPGRRRAACKGPADKIAGYLRTYADLGVDQIQVGFVSRSVDELCDQIAAFAADVAPLVNA